MHSGKLSDAFGFNSIREQERRAVDGRGRHFVQKIGEKLLIHPKIIQMIFFVESIFGNP